MKFKTKDTRAWFKALDGNPERSHENDAASGRRD